MGQKNIRNKNKIAFFVYHELTSNLNSPYLDKKRSDNGETLRQIEIHNLQSYSHIAEAADKAKGN